MQEHPTTTEEWRPVLGYEGRYEVSNHGRVRSIAGTGRLLGMLLRQRKNPDGYPMVMLYGGQKRRSIKVNTLVLEAFRGPRPESMQCSHLNGKRDDNRLSSLAWMTAKENNAMHIIHETWHHGERHPGSVLTVETIETARARRDNGEMVKDLAREYGVCLSTMSRALRGVTYRRKANKETLAIATAWREARKMRDQS